MHHIDKRGFQARALRWTWPTQLAQITQLARAVGMGGLAVAGHMGLAHADGDATRGAAVYASRCSACHSVDTNRVGPMHAGVLGRKAGSVASYAYSPALQASTVVWDKQTLARWLQNPEALIPGQRMGFSLGDEAARADVIAYLATLKAKD